MKKIIAVFLALLLILTLAVPASAVTIGRWDWNAARKSINNAATDLIRDQQTAPTEIPETEYVVVEETEITTEPEPEPVTETTHEQVQSWRDWLRSWGRWLRYERE